MVYPLEQFHTQHPHHLECPRCRRNTIVLQGQSRYICLNCGWRRDTDHGWEFALFPILVLAALMVILLMG